MSGLLVPLAAQVAGFASELPVEVEPGTIAVFRRGDGIGQVQASDYRQSWRPAVGNAELMALHVAGTRLRRVTPSHPVILDERVVHYCRKG